MAEYREQVKHLREWTVLDIQNRPAHTIRMMQAAADTIEKFDAVPVVRCKDCKHMEFTQVKNRYCRAWGRIQTMGDDGFCNFGERKDGDG